MPVENHVLTVRPVYDVTTQVLAEKISPIFLKYARDRLYAVYDLYDTDATRENYEINIMRRDPLIVAGFSHGLEDAIISDDETRGFLDVGNTITTNNRIVYLCACLTGKQLAPACVDVGARAVLAYDDTLTLVVDEKTLEPAEGFKEVLAEKPARIFDGLTVQQVYDEVIAEYNKWIEYWDNRPEEYAPIIADTLRHDRDHFKLYGSGISRISLSHWILVGTTDIFAITYVILYAIRNIIHLYKLFKR